MAYETMDIPHLPNNLQNENWSPQLCVNERERLARLEAYYADVRFRAYGTKTHKKYLASPLLGSPTNTLPKPQLGFLNLPSEIRNAIYRFVFVLPFLPIINGVDHKIPGIWLLATCKQVHEEASSIFYSENTFSFGLDIDWKDLPEIMLTGFPKTLPIWPAPCYHPYLSKLDLKFRFKSGDPTDVEAPENLNNSMQSMRDAYDSIWNDLDITFDFSQSDFSKLTFTMAWMKFRFFKPIEQANSTVVAGDKAPPLVAWCLEQAMKGVDPRDALADEQKQALQEATSIVEDIYAAYCGFQSLHELGLRFTWGSPFIRLGRLWRLYQQYDMYEGLKWALSSDAATISLREDNELRVCAAVRMPKESKNLNIMKSCDVRMYFALQESAMRITALTRSFEDTPKGREEGK